MANAVEWQRAKQKVASWLENEERCVTTQRVSQTLNLPRLEASHLLEEIYNEKKTKTSGATKFRITTCYREDREESVPVTVFRLRQSTSISRDSDETSQKSTIVALAALEGTESIATAHERDLMEWREMVADGRYQQQTNEDGAIVPADAVAPLKDAVAVNEIKPTAEEHSSRSSANFNNSRHKAFLGNAKKVTSAASFFGNNSKPKNDNASTAPPKSANVGSLSGQTTTSNIQNSQKHRPPQPTEAKENEGPINQFAPASQKNASSCSSSKNPKSFGNADDFVADEEESDEEDDALQVRKHKQVANRNVALAANKMSEETPFDDKDGDDDEEKAKVVGAMDAFATAAPKKLSVLDTNGNNGTRQRKRRKKLVEETVTVNGYLRTETKAIWEDVLTDEEKEEMEQERIRVVNSSSFKPSKSQQGMKQKSLMGFFAKRK